MKKCKSERGISLIAVLITIIIILITVVIVMALIMSSDENSSIATVEATIENPAQIGEWVETTRYSTGDKEYHTVYYRITEVIRGTESDEPQNIVDTYNEEGHVTYFSELEDEELEYNIVKYEVYFPDDFPASSNGNITSYDLYFNIKSPDGGGVEANGTSWIGLSSHDITDDDYEIYPGETMTEGIQVFTMVKNCSDYLFAVSNNDDEYTYTYVQGK